MHKVFKLAALAGALSMTMGGSAMAASDLVFDGWTVTSGTIDIQGNGTSICSANSGFDCSTVASGSGFTQVQVTPTAGTVGAVAGESYIMTVVTDQNATSGTSIADLGFYDVSFVKMKLSLGGNGDNNENGIAARQRISEITPGVGTKGATEFTSSTDINTGWSNGTVPVAISQSLIDNGDTSTLGDNFDSKFNYESSNDATTGLRDGFAMSIDQVAGLASVGDTNSNDDVQVFALRERQGTLQTTANSTGLDLGGGNVKWGVGEDIKAIWLGQTINLGGTPATGGSLGSQFGYLSFENVSDTQQAAPITEFGFAASNANSAWVWDPAFNIGTGSGTPCLDDPSGATCP